MSFLSNTEGGNNSSRRKLPSFSLKKKPKKTDIVEEVIKDTDYHYINDFDDIDEKTCIHYDKRNQEIYDKNLKFYTECKEYLETKKANFSLKESPKPPRKPSNHQLYVDFKKKNVKVNCIDQSLAIVYLLNKGYKIITDSDYVTEDIMIDNFCFEPHMAIELANNISHKNKENYKNYKNNNNYKNVYMLNNYNYTDYKQTNLPPYIENTQNNTNTSNTSNTSNNKPSAPPASHVIQYSNLLKDIDT